MYEIHIRSLTYSVPYNTASVSGRVGRLCAHYTECFVEVLKGPKKGKRKNMRIIWRCSIRHMAMGSSMLKSFYKRKVGKSTRKS